MSEMDAEGSDPWRLHLIEWQILCAGAGGLVHLYRDGVRCLRQGLVQFHETWMLSALDQAETLGDRLAGHAECPGSVSSRRGHRNPPGGELRRPRLDLLFQASVDGAAEDPELAAQLGFANLGFASWFVPFH